MNLYFRLIRVLLGSLFAERRHFSDSVESRFRVLPHDLDAFGHMNNGRYLQIMDVARTEWMSQTGIAMAIRKHRWAPLLGGGFVRFRHSLRILQGYTVNTRLIGWDQRWFFLEHSFIDDRDRCVAVGITRAALRKDGIWVSTKTVSEATFPGATSPAIPDYVEDWIRLENEMYRFGHRSGAAVNSINEVSL
ncbi:MAG: thioesterase family protein [Pseudomonadota bacterium]